jgi:hypothetical protein
MDCFTTSAKEKRTNIHNLKFSTPEALKIGGTMQAEIPGHPFTFPNERSWITLGLQNRLDTCACKKMLFFHSTVFIAAISYDIISLLSIGTAARNGRVQP